MVLTETVLVVLRSGGFKVPAPFYRLRDQVLFYGAGPAGARFLNGGLPPRDQERDLPLSFGQAFSFKALDELPGSLKPCPHISRDIKNGVPTAAALLKVTGHNSSHVSVTRLAGKPLFSKHSGGLDASVIPSLSLRHSIFVGLLTERSFPLKFPLALVD